MRWPLRPPARPKLVALAWPAGFPCREFGHHDSAGRRACDQRDIHLYPEGGSRGEEEPPVREEKVDALFLGAL